MPIIKTLRSIMRAIKPIINRIVPMIAESVEIVNAFVSGILGSLGLLCNMQELYDACHDEEGKEQRGIKIASNTISFFLNAVYTLGVFVEKIISNLGLGLIVLANSFITLCFAAYAAYSTRQKINASIQALEKIYQSEDKDAVSQQEMDLINTLAKQYEQHFKNKVDVSYNIALLAAAGCFTGAFVFAPLLIAGIVLISLITLVELYDRSTELGFSRWLEKKYCDEVKSAEPCLGNTRDIAKMLSIDTIPEVTQSLESSSAEIEPTVYESDQEEEEYEPILTDLLALPSP